MKNYDEEKEKEIKSFSVKDAVEYFVNRDLRTHILKPEELNALTHWKAKHYGFLEIVMHRKTHQHEN